MLSNDIINKIYIFLMSDLQDIHSLQKKIERETAYSKADIQKLIYNISLNINSSLLPEITQLELILTNNCPLACSYCFEKQMHSIKNIKLTTARAAIDLLFDYSKNAQQLDITLFGGEPTLNFPAIKQISEYAEKKALTMGKSLDFNMTTNGILLNEKMMDFFTNHKIKVLLSIDGLEKSHDSVRFDKKGIGTFKRVMKGLELLKQKQKWVGAKVTVVPQNVPTLYDDITGLHDIGINQFIIGYATGIRWSNNEMICYCDQMKKIYDWYKSENRDDLKIVEFEKVEQKNFFGCRAGHNCISVSVAGEISPCSKLLSINDKQIIAKLGDVKYGLTGIKNRINLIECEKLKSSCKTLGIARDYHGGCFADNYEENNDIFQPCMQNYEFSKRINSIFAN